MNRRQFSLGWSIALVVAAILTWANGAQAASKYKVIYDFGKPGHGYRPVGNLALDSKGNFFGVTVGGGRCCGEVVYKLTATHSGWKESPLSEYWTWGTPNGGLAIDAAGNFYGTDTAGQSPGGAFYGGDVFGGANYQFSKYTKECIP